MRRIVLAACVAVLLVSMVAVAATAKSQSKYRTDGKGASAYWTQVDGPPAADPSTQPFGNVHVGWLDVWETSPGEGDAFVYIDDFRCPEGVLPGHGGHEVIEPEPEPEPDPDKCVHVGSRFGEGYGLAFRLDRRLSSGSLQGQLVLTHGGHGHEPGTVVGRPNADMRWTGTGTTWKSVGTWRTSGGGSSYFDRYRHTSRNATVSGTLGPMGFDPDLSGGTLSSYSSMYHERSR